MDDKNQQEIANEIGEAVLYLIMNSRRVSVGSILDFLEIKFRKCRLNENISISLPAAIKLLREKTRCY